MNNVPASLDSIPPALHAIAASGPHPELRDPLQLFGQFVGEWDIDGVLIDEDGQRHPHPAEWLFTWALEGRAIQDVLIAPPLHQDATGVDRFEYGTTIRFYDPPSQLWRITYISPVAGTVHRLDGGLRGDAIVLEGPRSSGELQRWQFSDITANSFLWTGRVSTDDGNTWRVDEEMRARRR